MNTAQKTKRELTDEEAQAMGESMADGEFGEGTFADWYNDKSD